ncbi:MAG TPA: metal ABC transporter ATP-binding protein [Nocardioidaceae bacterium]|jgi:zinc transport system ATP-binding protein
MTTDSAHAHPVVSIRAGNVALGGRPVLRGIDLTVRQGEVVAILGANGSGKSTLVRGLMGLTAWTSGDVRLLGTPLPKFHEWYRVGYVPQRVTASAGVPATVAEVVGSGRLARRRLLMPMSRADRVAVRDAIAAVELSDRTHDAVAQLSGGQQQRVLIARALAGQPELFVLDEPNAGVDRHNQIGLAETLRPLVARGGTVLLVLHELGPLASLIDRAVVVREGRIVYDGPPPDDAALEEFHDHHRPRQSSDHVPMRSGWDL